MQNGNNNGNNNNNNDNLNDVKNNQKIIVFYHIAIIAEELLLSPNHYGKLRYIHKSIAHP